MSEQLIPTPSVFGETGNFLLERELGCGGMGGVYMGRDKMLDRPVAVKVMLKELGSDPDFVERFKREAQAAARLIHPNIAQIYSYGIANGMPYIAMELVAGGSLEQLMKNSPGKTDVPRVMKIGEQVAQALRCAADQGLVHGDIKPENILFDANGNAKIVDFGLAGMQKNTDEIWGTPYYIAPEKVRKEVVDYRADMYSLGATLYHALTGVAPFEGADATAVVKKRFEETPKKPSEIRAGISPQIDTLIMTMLSFNKEDRYPSFEALLEEFHKVMASGLTTTQTVATSAANSAAGEGDAEGKEESAATTTKKKTLTTSRTGKHITIKGKRTMSMKKPGSATIKKPLVEEDDEDEDDEEGGSVGGKVALVIFGIILILGGLAGGLWWYKVSEKNSANAEVQAKISGDISAARKAIVTAREKAVKFDSEFATFANEAVTSCSKYTLELAKLLPDFASDLKPPETQELLDAIYSTNTVAQAAAAQAASNAVAKAAAEAAAASNAAFKVTKEDVAKGVAKATALAKTQGLSLAQLAKKFGLPPPPEDLDPNSPEGADYLAKVEEAKKKFAAGEMPKPEEASAESAAEPEVPKELPQVVKDMQEIWNRAYSCQAAVIRIHVLAQKLIDECDKADEYKGETTAAGEKLAELTQTTRNMYEQLTASPDVEAVKKAKGYINSRGEKVIKKTVNDIRIAKLEAERKAKKEAAEKAERERQERMAAEKAAKIETETKSIKDKFEAIASAGTFRLLDWGHALRQLNALKDTFTTAEGLIAAKEEIRKVEAMKSVQDIFIQNMTGYEFRKANKKFKLRGCKVKSANDKEIVLQRADGNNKNPLRLTWKKFYEECPDNLNELLNKFVVKGRGTTMLDKKQLTLKSWSDAMLGAALTMRIICAEVPGALSRSEELVKETLKQFPDYQKVAQAMFPDLKLDDIPTEE